MHISLIYNLMDLIVLYIYIFFHFVCMYIILLKPSLISIVFKQSFEILNNQKVLHV